MASRVIGSRASYVREQCRGHLIAESELDTEPPSSGEIETVRVAVGSKNAVIFTFP